MYRNILEGAITPEDILAVETAISTIEQRLTLLVALEAADRRKFASLGPESQYFAEGALLAAQQNIGLIPASLDVTAIQRDKALRDQLVPIYERLQKLTTRMDNTIFLSGAEFYSGALAIYRVLQAFGKAAGLEVLLQDLGRRFSKTKKKRTDPATPTNPTDPSI